MNRSIIRGIAVTGALGLLLAGCHGGGSGSPLSALPSAKGVARLTLTVSRGSATTSGAQRSPKTIPAGAVSVSAQINVGGAGAPPSTIASASCATFSGTVPVTLSLSAPYGTDTLVVQSWNGPCNAGNTLGTGTVLSTFSGTGTVNAPTGDAGAIFNGATGPISLGTVAPLSAVQFTNLGPVWQNVLNGTTISGDLAGSGKIQSVAIDPNSSSTLYIAGGDGTGFEVNVSSGIYKSTNSGSTWNPIGFDTGLDDTRVNGLVAVNDAGTTILLAATEFGGIYRSSDGGASWTQVDTTAPAMQFAQLGSTIYVADSAGVEQSTDYGVTWTLAGTGFSSAGSAFGSGANSIAAAPPSTLIAGDFNGYTWSYNGTTWSKGGQLAATALGCGSGGNSVPAAVHTIAIDQTTPSTIWATGWSCTMGGAAVSQELYLSTNGGANWSDVATQASKTGAGGNPTGYYGSQMLADSSTVAHEIYMGAEFTEWSALPVAGTPPTASYTPVVGQSSTTQGNTYGDMRGLTVLANSSGGDACYIASDQGLYYQPTCGQSSGLPQPLTGGLSTNYLYGFGVGGSADNATIMTTIQDFGPAATALPGNGGGLSAADWTGSFNGTSSLGEGGDAEISPFKASDCVVSQTSAPALNYSTDGCLTFNPTSPSTLASVSSLSFSRKTPGLLFIADGTGGLYKSTDDGATATLVSGSSALLTGGDGVSFIRVDPENDNNLFAIVTNATSGAGSIEYSTNGGATWTASTTTFTSAPAALAIDPQNSLDIVAVGGSGALTIYTSNNGGVSFTGNQPVGLSVARQMMSLLARRTQTFPLRFAPPRPPWRLGGINARLSPPVAPEEWAQATIAPQYATSLEFNPAAPAGQQPILVLATGYGLYGSGDGGVTWTRLDGGTNATTISRRFTKVEWLDGYLYASTDGQGLLRSQQPLQ